MAEEKPRKTTKRAVAKKVTKKASAKKVARKVTTKATARKAAPRREIKPVKKKMSFGFLFISLFVLLGAATASLYFGYNDEGQINVANQIKKNSGIGIDGSDTSNIVPAPPTGGLPNSGMTPSAREVPRPTPEVEDQQATSTATSTEATASSTTAVAEDAADDVSEVDEETAVEGVGKDEMSDETEIETTAADSEESAAVESEEF